MSWWDTSSISNFATQATQALKSAQKKIDKVLDIEAEEKSGKSRRKKAPLSEQGTESAAGKEGSKEEKGGSHDFWSGWMGKSEEDKPASSPSQGSSWHLPWASPSQEFEATPAESPSAHLSSSEWSNTTSRRLSLRNSRRRESAKENVPSQPAAQEESQPQTDTGVERLEETSSSQVKAEEISTFAAEESADSISETTLVSNTQTRQSAQESIETSSEEQFIEDNQSKAFPQGNVFPQETCEDKLIDAPDQSDQTEKENILPKAHMEFSVAEAGLKQDGSPSASVSGISEIHNLDIQADLEDQHLKLFGSAWQDDESDLVLDEDIDDDNVEAGKCVQSEQAKESIDKPEVEGGENSANTVVEHSSEFVEALRDPPAENCPQGLDKVEQADDVKHDDTKAASMEDVASCDDIPQTFHPSVEHHVVVEEAVKESHISCTVPVELVDAENIADPNAVAKPDTGQDSRFMSSNNSLIGDSEEKITDDSEGAKTLSQSGDDLALSEEYSNMGSACGNSQVISLDGSATGSVCGNSQVISLDSSATGSDDCLQSSSEFDLGAVSSSSIIDPDPEPVRELADSTGSSDTSRLDSSADTVVVERTCQGSETEGDGDVGYSLFGNFEGARSLSHEEREKCETNEDLSSPDAAYVKTLIQEAMDDMSNKTEDSSSDNHSNSEIKSEGSKIDSEMEKSVHSGHESSDEIETTTSSDIEILSAPHSNGESGTACGAASFHSTFDFTPLQQRGHHRAASDSHSSSSSHSKAGDGERLSPERAEGTVWREDDCPHHELAAVKEEGRSNPYHPEKLLKLAQAVVQQELRGGQKLAEMAEVLQARETKLIQLSKENHSLAEDTSILRRQLQKAEEARDAEAADLDALTQEFTLRIGEAEKKMQTVLKEKERLRQQLTAAEKELERRSADADVEAMLEEKRQQVEELLQEGEKLSKQQLQSSNIIKKLRAKEKENEATITSQKKKLEDQSAELDHLKLVLNSKEEMEKKQTEAIGQLNNAVQKQEKELVKLRSDLEDAQEKSRGLQVALDNSYKEIAELHKSNATQDSKAQEAALSAETHVREELRAAMEREQIRFKQEREAFIMQADDLRLDMARLEKEHSRREELLRQEIAHLQTRLQEDEARSQDLTQSVSSATRPLLRQIENLQATYGAQANAWERVEKNLTDRLAEAQTSLAVAQEKERMSSQQYMELSAKVAALEASNTSLRQEKAKQAAKIEKDRSRLEELQDTRDSIVAQLESSKKSLCEELAQLKLEKMHVESQLSVERTRVETEKKKSLALEDQLRIAERPRSRGTPSPSPSMSVSRQESIVGSVHEGYAGNMMNWSFHQDESDSGSTVGVSRASVYDSLRQSGAAIAVENMSSQLKLREGEITQLQSEISRLERTRESMARELVNLSNQNEELQEIKEGHEQLQQEHKV
ncbi:TATA-element modulatory factor [Plakobranchus ocellatus]|uniref:TATA-element modulatory factor n=1 Tax=Plakobranchus ocellatus TaxID=259542 RepID=A0AAV4CNE5_9GAST|nr:TATA-element modulatory factor [Plakobranchus ocellatus]